jgi:hypothetical protein
MVGEERMMRRVLIPSLAIVVRRFAEAVSARD